MTFALLDVDGLDAINSTYGRAVGDRVLVMGRDGTRLQVLHWMDW